MSLPQDKVQEVCTVATAHLNAAIVELRRLFLVEDLVDSAKFGVLLWVLTYLGSWFNGMTLIIIGNIFVLLFFYFKWFILIILAWVALFTLPKIYQANQVQIDTNLEIVRVKIAEIAEKYVSNESFFQLLTKKNLQGESSNSYRKERGES